VLKVTLAQEEDQENQARKERVVLMDSKEKLEKTVRKVKRGTVV